MFLCSPLYLFRVLWRSCHDELQEATVTEIAMMATGHRDVAAEEVAEAHAGVVVALPAPEVTAVATEAVDDHLDVAAVDEARLVDVEAQRITTAMPATTS